MKDYNLRNKYFDDLLKQTDLKWMGQNTNHLPAHEHIIDEMTKSIKKEEFHFYAPPLGLEELRGLVINHLGLTDHVAMITDGAVSGLFNICKILCSEKNHLITTDPTWIWPVHFAEATGANVTQIPIYGEEYRYTLQADRLNQHIKKNTNLIYLVDPNNPLGTVFDEKTISEIVKIAKQYDLVIIHDCTYRDFSRSHTLIAQYYPEKTITVWSFSKWLGMAGLRIGAIVTSDLLMDRIARYPSNILGSNIVAQRGAVAGLKIKNEWFPKVNAIQRENQDTLYSMVRKLKGLSMPIYPSNTNFVIIEIGDPEISPEALSFGYAKRGFMIRQGSYHTLNYGHKFVKVSLSVPKSWAESFVKLLPVVLSESKGMIEIPKLF